jgi:NAD(P)H-dependent FMN reductase
MSSTEQPTTPLRVAIIAGSTRPNRKADKVAQWVHGIASKRGDAVYEVVDLADYELPLLNEPRAPMAGKYEQPHTLKWAATIASFDAYIFVTPEYNHSVPGALKNAIDYLFAEWNDKAAGFVGYGFFGGANAIEHLRLVLGELKVADVRTQVALMFGDDFEGYTKFTPRAPQEQRLAMMLDDLTEWASAFRVLRKSREAANPPSALLAKSGH